MKTRIIASCIWYPNVSLLKVEFYPLLSIENIANCFIISLSSMFETEKQKNINEFGKYCIEAA